MSEQTLHQTLMYLDDNYTTMLVSFNLTKEPEDLVSSSDLHLYKVRTKDDRIEQGSVVVINFGKDIQKNPDLRFARVVVVHPETDFCQVDGCTGPISHIVQVIDATDYLAQMQHDEKAMQTLAQARQQKTRKQVRADLLEQYGDSAKLLISSNVTASTEKA